MKYLTRYFNKIVESQNFLYKSSLNVAKIKAEYEYYYLLPETLKKYFVKPTDLVIKDGIATYCMDKIYREDAAKQVTRYSMDIHSFKSLLVQIEQFQNESEEVEVLNTDGINIAYDLIINKTLNRINMLNFSTGNLYERLSSAFDYYKDERKIWKIKISHGDLCLSNILWKNDILFIDPKGAENLDQLYLDEYYDIAKLSHSILGGYDFINRGMHDFNMGAEFIEEFKLYLNRKDIKFNLLKVYEASLFLSMLPFHTEDFNKINYFMAKCDTILEEIGF